MIHNKILKEYQKDWGWWIRIKSKNGIYVSQNLKGGKKMEKKLTKRFLWASLVCLLILLFASSAFPQKKRISIAGAQAGGGSYVIAVGCAEIINRFLPEYNAVALETGGTAENIRLLSKGEVEYANGDMQAVAQAYRAEKPFTTPIKNIQIGFYLYAPILHIVTLEKSKIKTVEDLKGKVVSVGVPGSTVAYTTETVLRLHNISMKDLTVRYLSPSDAMDALADGVIDAGVLYSALPSSAVVSLAVRQKVRLVSANEKLLKAAEVKENMICLYVPPETYKGQAEGATVWSVVGATYYNEKTSAEDVYKWTKAIMEHRDVVEKIHPLGKELRLLTKKELEVSTAPLHPGIIKYAKEVGINY